MSEKLLLGPGPSNVAVEVRQALAKPILGHLDPEFLTILDRVAERLRLVFQTSNRLTFAVSGTGSSGMEAAFVNLLEPGDKAIVCVNGVFGNRMADIVSRCGAICVRVESPWGSSIDPLAIATALDVHPDAKLVAVVHAETSTGAASDVKAIADCVAGRALLVVDAVTSLAGMPVEVDAWGIDVCYSGTQKCLSVPPGLAPITFSERALELIRARSTAVSSWYLDVTMLERYWGSDRVYHHTAPVAMIAALDAGLGVVLDEGLETRHQRHSDAAWSLSQKLLNRGFSYVPTAEVRLPMLHCLRIPEHIDDKATRTKLLNDFEIEVGGGLGEFAGSCWRIGLMGQNAQESTVERLVNALDEVIA